MKSIYKLYIGCTIAFFSGSCQSPSLSNLNEQASIGISDELPENPLELIPITSTVHPQDSIMSTLYGNKIAAYHAMHNGDTLYPKGALLYEVTWKQQPDPEWFGANIPKEVKSVERVLFSDKLAEYHFYSGKPLRENIPRNARRRLEFIISQRMAVSP